jgi:hypothetical protein
VFFFPLAVGPVILSGHRQVCSGVQVGQDMDLVCLFGLSSVCFSLFGLLFLLSHFTRGSVSCLFDASMQMQNNGTVGLRIGAHYR